MEMTARLGLKAALLYYILILLKGRNGDDSPVGIESSKIMSSEWDIICRNGDDSPVGIERSCLDIDCAGIDVEMEMTARLGLKEQIFRWNRMSSPCRNGDDSPVGIER